MANQGDGGEEDAFLQDFVANRRWLDPHASKEAPRCVQRQEEQEAPGPHSSNHVPCMLCLCRLSFPPFSRRRPFPCTAPYEPPYAGGK